MQAFMHLLSAGIAVVHGLLNLQPTEDALRNILRGPWSTDYIFHRYFSISVSPSYDDYHTTMTPLTKIGSALPVINSYLLLFKRVE